MKRTQFASWGGAVLATALLSSGLGCSGQAIPVGYDGDAATHPNSGSGTTASTSGSTNGDGSGNASPNPGTGTTSGSTEAGAPPTNVNPVPQPTNTMPGTGSALGGCPATEPPADSACSTPGRLCKWTRSCGAGGVVGWCTPAKTWKVVAPICQAGCPAWPPGQSFGSQFGPPPDAMCMAGLDCRYHSNPIQGGTIQHCRAGTVGGTIWTLPDSWNDGWVPAPAGPASNACSELATCSGMSGCAGACPDPAPKSCYCGPDGLYYCEVGPACGGGVGTVTAVKPAGAPCSKPADCATGVCALSAAADGGSICQ